MTPTLFNPLVEFHVSPVSGNCSAPAGVFSLTTEDVMNRRSTILIAIGAATAAVLLATPADAQSGHALVLAEKACFDQGIRPNTAAFDRCVDRLVAPDHVPSVTWPSASMDQAGTPTAPR
jgi:hypothetical protein